jgi:hypothetical protein
MHASIVGIAASHDIDRSDGSANATIVLSVDLGPT